MKRRQLLVHAASIGAVLSLPSVVRAQAGRLVIGQSAALSGPAAELGRQMNAGAQLVFDAVNAAGGVNGNRIELRAMDDGYEPERCKGNTERLLKDDVFALFGYVGTPTSLAALPFVRESKVPFFAPVTGASALREPLLRNCFHVRASYVDETAELVRQLTGVGLRRIAVFHQNDAYGQSGLDGVTKALKAQGLAPVAVGTVERNSVDVAAAVKTLVAAQPQAIVQVSAYTSCAAFVRQARKAGYGGTFANVSFVGTQALADELGKDAAGITVSQVMPFPFSTTTAISREYLEALRKAGGDARPNYSAMEGFIAAKVFVEGLHRAGGKPSRESLVAGLESIQRTDFGGFKVNFSARDHVASNYVDLSMLTGDGRVKH